MPKINENYLNLKESYLFTEINHRVAEYTKNHPDKKVIRLGIGDVTRPLGQRYVINALHEGVDAMASAETFKGYGPEQGYAFLRDAVAKYYAGHGVSIDPGDIFISDGAKSDTGNITDIFGDDNVILIPDPVYPFTWTLTLCAAERSHIFPELLKTDSFLFRIRISMQT